MSKPSTFIISTVVLTAFIFGMFAGVGAQNQSVPTGNVEAIQQPDVQGPLAPHGTWQRHIEDTVLFLHKQAPLPLDDNGVPQVPTGSAFEDGYFDYERPTHLPDVIRTPGITAHVVDPNDPNVMRATAESGLKWNARDDAASPDKPVVFEMLSPGPAAPGAPFFERDLEFYEIFASVKGTCASLEATSEVSTEDIGLHMHIDVMDRDGSGTWVARDFRDEATSSILTTGNYHTPWRTVHLNPTSAVADSNRGTFTYEGNWESPENPRFQSGDVWRASDNSNAGPAGAGEVIPADSRIRISFTPSVDYARCTLYFDTDSHDDSSASADVEGYVSYLRIAADSGRINTWVDNKDDQHAIGLPAPASTAPERRQFKVQVAHASLWPGIADLPGKDGIPENYLDKPWVSDDHSGVGTFDRIRFGTGMADNHRKEMQIWYRGDQNPAKTDTRVYDTRTGSWDSVIPLDRSVKVAGNNTNVITYLFSYTGGLDEGEYQVDAYTRSFGTTLSPLVTVGLKAFQISAIGDSTHEINVGEQTTFHVLVENTGSERDTISTFVPPPGENWQAQVVNGKLTLEPGGVGEVLVRVTPPSTATVGTSKAIEVRSSSAFPNEVPLQTLSLTTKVVSGGSHGAELLGNPGLVEIFAGEEIDISGLRIHNEAPFTDTYLLKPVIPADVVGWTVKANPPSRTTSADSIDDFTVTIKAPSSAPQGLGFNLALQAVRIGGTAPADTMIIPVEVVLVPGLDVGLFTESLSPRDSGRDDCVPDVIFTGLGCYNPDHVDDHADEDALFRVEITNPSAKADQYRVQGRWTAGTDLKSGCSDSGEHPDYWRMNFGDAADLTGAPGRGGRDDREENLGTVTVPPFTTVYRYLQLGYVEVDHCVFNENFADPVKYRLTLTSLTDQSIVKKVEATVDLASEGTPNDIWQWFPYTTGVHLEPDRVDGKQRFVDTTGSTVKQGNAYEDASYQFRVINTGNQDDTVIVDVPKNTHSGWTQRLAWVAEESVPQDFTCSIPDGKADENNASRSWQFTCSGMGVHDEAVFQLFIGADGAIPLRSSLDTVVSAKSAADGSKSDTLTFTTRTVGQFSFEAVSLKSIRKAPQGSDVTLGFQVNNEGTAGDSYTIAIIDGPASWKPRLSSDQQVFIPGGSSQTGFVIATVPADATLGSKHTFRVQVTSDSGAGINVLDYQVEVISPASLSVAGVPSNSLVLPSRGAPNEVTVRATSDTGPAGVGVKFDIDQAALPQGWSVDTASQTVGFAASGAAFAAEATFQVTPPVNALSTSRVPFITTATTQEGVEADRRSVTQDLVLSLQADVSVRLEALSAMPQTVLPGGEVVYEVDVINDGLAQDTIILTDTGMPEGWTVMYDPAQPTLGPLEARVIDVIVKAPTNAPAAQNATFALFATSQTDSTAFDSLTVSTVVGFNELAAAAKQTIVRVAPEETADFIVTVDNTGTVPDQVRATAQVVSAGLEPFVQVEVAQSVQDVSVNTSKDYRISVRATHQIPSEVAVQVNVTFASLLDTRTPAASVVVPLVLQVERYEAQDIDSDGIREYAVDRDRDSTDGFEEFRESRTPGGRVSQAVQVDRYLTDEARESFMVQVTDDDGNTSTVFRFMVDGDEDGRVDHLIDSSGDGLPNVYWDPDRRLGNKTHAMALTVVKDVNADAVLDYFVDVDGDGLIDRVFDLRSGLFTAVLVRDIDGDGTADYAVDANGNGIIDPDETVLFTRGGVLVTVLKVDVDGDGELDDVFDTDGDGRVDSFIRAGETTARKIILKDVDGDGTLDWLYDSNGDGRADQYYNPATKTGGHLLDSQATFTSLARSYWFVPVLFGLVLVLFVVLIAVTRR